MKTVPVKNIKTVRCTLIIIIIIIIIIITNFCVTDNLSRDTIHTTGVNLT